MQLAQEYLQAQTEIACLLQAKEDLERQLEAENQLGSSERSSSNSTRERELRELLSENVCFISTKLLSMKDSNDLLHMLEDQ